ncbi:hypothetical protein AC249_AIPGENE16628 [Exaiptasia diaphana]|nr:hypothetical protein AC249_AIPGENE16628 [Exaiptasia diaphana]
MGMVKIGIFAFGFLSGIASYRKTCMEKIMRLENSQLADQVRSFYKKAGMTEQMTDRNITEDFESQSGFGDETQGYPSRNEGNIGKSFEMSSLPEIEDDNTKQSDRYTSYEELRRFNRNQWMQVSPRQPVNAQQPQNMKEERPALQDADDYHSSVDTYQSDISSSVWSEGSTSEQDNNIHKRQRATRPGPAPMKNAYGDVLEK